MSKFFSLITRSLFAFCIIWSTGVHAFFPPKGKCEDVSVSTYYQPMPGMPARIPAGSEHMGKAIGKIMGNFSYKCRPFFTLNPISLGVFLSGSGGSYKSGSGAQARYHSNIEGLELRLPPVSDVIAANLNENFGMREGRWGGEL